MKNSRYYLFVAVMFLGICSAEDVWGGTEDPKDWPSTFPDCGGKKQSPIRIDTSAAEEWNATDKKKKNFEMKFNGYDKEANLKAYNTGYLPNITYKYFSQSVRSRITLTQNGETVEYFMTNIHFHWPSEHALDNRSSVFETHVVHRNLEMNRAIILAFLINECGVSMEEDLYMYDSYVAKQIETPGSFYSYITRPKFFMPQYFQCGYYMYEGSFTIPPCTEGVTWFVHDKTACIDRTVIAAFKNMKNNNGTLIQSNNRPFQDNDIKVIYLPCNEEDYDDDYEK